MKVKVLHIQENKQYEFSASMWDRLKDTGIYQLITPAPAKKDKGCGCGK